MRHPVARRIALGVLGLALCIGLAACGPKKPAEPERPSPPDLATPRAAVDSYLDWVSYAYRIADAEPASPTMSPPEFVRVEAYVQRNRDENKGIEQHLTSFKQRGTSTESSGATLAATERWEYQYFTLRPLAYSGDELKASYETTYTLVKTPAGWVVDDIQVREIGETK